VRNAVQALDGRGTIRLRTCIERGITIGQRRHRLTLRAEVEDNGPGIPPELLEHIFYPMVTGRAEGTGLGLSIAQDILTKHGGLIECETRPGRTVFILYLPLENGNG
jgi:two-component system nitrogen regulation sensor histidine kinase GlnL